MWLEGSTVGECLDYLLKEHPETEKLLFDGQGRLLRRVYVYVNAESMQKAKAAQTLRESDQLLIAVLASGG